MTPASDTILSVCDEIGSALQRGKPVSIGELQAWIRQLRAAARPLRSMEEWAGERIDEARAAPPPFTVVGGGRR
jgi:hypothetical protein